MDTARQERPPMSVFFFHKATTHPTIMNHNLRTLLTAALAACSTLLPAQNLFDRLAMEGVDFVGSVTYGLVDSYTAMDAGYYSFNYETRYQANKTTALHKALVAGGCTYHDGKVYAAEYDDAQQLSSQKPMWRIYDAQTFTLLSERELEDGCVSTTQSLAYDPTTDRIYGINRSYTATYLVSIDPETGAPTRVGNDFERADANGNAYRYAALTVDTSGRLYCVYMKNENDGNGEQVDRWYLAKVRKSDGKFATVGEITMQNLLDGDTFINDTRDQALFCNTQTGKMYWVFGSSSMELYSEYTCIAEMNTTTAVASLVAYVSKPVLLSGAFFREPAALAPGVVTDFAYLAESDGALRGQLQFRLPSTAYDGSTLSGQLSYWVVEGEDTLLSGKAEAGSLITSDMLDLENGEYNVEIATRNDAGRSPAVKRSFFVGYDTPTACRNITLTADGLTTTLTWDAPTVGQSGAVIDASKLTYNVVRYPGETSVATGITERSFSETHPEDMTRYVYLVTPVIGTLKGTSAYSNNLIVGTPLDVPYGGAFTGPADMINYYTILDANGDSNSWRYDTSSASAVYLYSATTAADDWLIAPPINYQAGHTYVLTFEAHSALEDYPERLTVCFGDARTPESLGEELLHIESVPTPSSSDDKNTYELEFTVSTDGVYYYAFHVTTDAYHGNLFLSTISVRDKDDTSGISGVEQNAGSEQQTFDLNGRRTPSLRQGVNIVRTTTGTRKVVVR